MIFPSLSLEDVLQVEDKTRIKATGSFISGAVEVITDVLIQPESTELFISVFNADKDKWNLDWAYITEGFKDVVVKVVTDLGERTKSYQINVISEATDALFSGDADIFPYEPELTDFIPTGKNSFLYAHRKAQDKVIAYLDEQRVWKNDKTRYTKLDISILALADAEILEQFKFWSTFETLMIVLEANQVSLGDIFQEKKSEYELMRNQARNRSAIRLDANDDGILDTAPHDFRTFRMIRR
jgi:hypothetical protein